MQQADARNRIMLPKVERTYGVQLPPEQYCLTGTGWNLKEGWESDDDVATLEEIVKPSEVGREDERMGGMDGPEDEEGEEEEGAGRMEDVFGTDAGGDTSMAQD